MLYQYKAVSEQGKLVSATIDADSLRDAKEKLIRRQVAVYQIEVAAEQQMKIRLSRQELLNLTKELSRLLHAGLPLFESLCALEEKYQKQKAHRILLDLSDQIKNGISFSLALSRHPLVFDLLYISMVANAEKTGRLAFALQELEELLSRQQKVKKALLTAFLYPAMLSGFCFVVLSSLLFYVIPSLKELFDGKDLHPFTLVVFSISDFACRTKGWLLSFVFLLLLSFTALFFSSTWKQKCLSWCYRLVLLKPLFIKVAFVRFGRAAATLLDGGVPLVQAFEGARQLCRHPELEKVIARAEMRISQGESVAAPFRNEPLVPSLVPRMLGIAEEGGELPFMMRQIAEIYEDELERALHTFANAAQPILLLVLGLIIGFVLLSVLLPLTDVSSFAAN